MHVYVCARGMFWNFEALSFKSFQFDWGEVTDAAPKFSSTPRGSTFLLLNTNTTIILVTSS